MTILRVAAGQLSSGPDKAENLRLATELIERAAAAQVRLLALPEATMISFDGPLAPHAEPLDGPWVTALAEAACRAGITVVAGVFEPADDGRVHNTLVVRGPAVSADYRKIHLYDAFGTRESDTVSPGDELVIVEVDGVAVGLATCYDVRFAEQFTQLGRRGAQLIVLPASWGDGPGKTEQWDLLTRARAADAQAWLLACGQAWRPESVRGPYGVGRSVLADPLGAVRARAGGAAELLVAQIDTERVDEVRRTVPILR